MQRPSCWSFLQPGSFLLPSACLPSAWLQLPSLHVTQPPDAKPGWKVITRMKGRALDCYENVKYEFPLCRGILEWILISGPKGCGFDSCQCLALLSYSKTLSPHCCSPPRCINGYPVGCEGYVVYVFACNAMIGSSARNAPLGVEIVHYKCGLEIASDDRGNNSMLRLEHPHWMDMCALQM